MRLKLAAYIASEDWRKRYDYVGDFREGLARVELKRFKWGFVNEEGKEVVEPKYYYVGDFHKGFARVKLNGKGWGFVNKEGEEVVEPQYDGVGLFDDGFARVKLNGKWGFVNKEGVEVLPPEYSEGYLDSLKTYRELGGDSTVVVGLMKEEKEETV